MAATASASNPSNMRQAFAELPADIISAVTNPRVFFGGAASSATARTAASKAVLSHIEGNGVVSNDDMKNAIQNAGFSSGLIGSIFNGKALSRPRVDAEMVQAAQAAADVVKRSGISGQPTKEQLADLTEQAMQSDQVRALRAKVRGRNDWKGISGLGALAGSATGGVALGGLAFAVKAAVETVKMLAGRGSVSAVFKTAFKYGAVGAAGGAVLGALPFGAAALSRSRLYNKRDKAIQEIVAKAVENVAYGRTPADRATAQGRVEPVLEPVQQQAQAAAPEVAKAEAPVAGTSAKVPDFSVAATSMKPASVTYSFSAPKKAGAAEEVKQSVSSPTLASAQAAASLMSAIATTPAAKEAAPASGVAKAVEGAAKLAATAAQVAATIKPDFGNKISYGTVTYSGEAKLGTEALKPGKTPETPGAKAETTRG